MQVAVLASQRAPHQLAHQAAMVEGLRAIGVDAQPSFHSVTKCDYVACWGWRLGKQLKAIGKRVLVMERGYLGDRFAWTSLGWDGLNGYAKHPMVTAGPERFQSMAELKPWKTGGKHVLILGQVPGDASLQGRDMMPLYADWAAKASNAYESPVHFRPHPKALEKGHRQNVRGTTLSTGGLAEALSDALVAICWNSNAAVDAVLAGVPVVTLDRGSMAWDVSAHRIGDLVRPARESWANQLAYRQWSLDEIRSGVALAPLFEMEVHHG